ncbi:hypothetical protein L596_023326 [Steinernema carpocapsae]|uniref:Major facilitator superfamily (MFS) profile domain-containing protein n=1 Tax=Steinernema carpocapsae TaxID=34508 RepID=A0A4U5MDC7_STECR|nr:hypothetical protein L596_023326 [Steinernema carpocapsae]
MLWVLVYPDTHISSLVAVAMKQCLNVCLSLLCMSLVLGNAGLFHFTMICMNPENSTIPDKVYTTFEESYIVSSVAVGRLIGSMPTISLMNKAGLRITFTIFGFISGFATLCMPLFPANLYFACFIRVLQGASQTSVYVAHGAIPLAWGGVKQQGRLVSVLSCCYEFSPMLSMALSGLFCTSSFGWPGVYYLFGVTTISCFVVFFLVYTDVPKHKIAPRVDSNEVTLCSFKPHQVKKIPDVIPYKAIFSTPSVWGIFMTALGDAVGYAMFVIYGPVYMNKVLHYQVTTTGLLTAYPFLISIFAKSLGGLLLDKIHWISHHAKVISFTAFAQGAMTTCFLVLTFITAKNYVTAQVIFTLTVVFSGLHCVGEFSTSQTVAYNYNHIITTVISVENGLTALFLPTIVAFINPDQNAHEWAKVFYGIVGVLVVTNIAYLALTKVKPAKWTNAEMNEKNEETSQA